MKSLGQLFVGLLTAIGSSLIVLAAALLALQEGTTNLPLLINPTLTAPAPGITLSPVSGQELSPTPTHPFILTATPSKRCAYPQGWVPYSIQPGDTVESLAKKAGISVDALKNANCMVGTSLEPGWVLYLPIQSPTSTPTSVPPTLLPTVPVVPPVQPTQCGHPYGWVIYIVQPGDTLSRLSVIFGVSVYQLQIANCLPDTSLDAYQQLWVPFRLPPTRTPVPTFTSTPTTAPATLTPTKTTPPANKKDQVITFGKLSNHTYGDSDFTVNATASSGLPVSFTAVGVCAMAGANTIHITGVGTCTVTASQAGDASYNPAPDVPQAFQVAKGTATVTLGQLNFLYDGTPKTTTAETQPAGLAVTITYSPSNPPVNAGSYAVVATVSDPNYTGSANGTLVISKASQTVTLGPLPNRTEGDPDFPVNASATSNLPVTLNASGNCTIAGNMVHMTGPGTCTITAAQAGNNNYEAASASQTFLIAAKTYPYPNPSTR